MFEKHMSLKARIEAEQNGGTLPVYVPRERDAVVGYGKKGELACFYCGFEKDDGHDYACRYTWWVDKLNKRTVHGVTIIDVPVGGLKASESFF